MSATSPAAGRRAIGHRLRRGLAGALALVAASWLGPAVRPAWAAAAAIQLQPVVTGLDNPVLVASPPGDHGRLFIVEQPGTIKVLEAGASAPRVFLDLRANVFTGDHQGLVGLAFHPQYAANGRFFVDYTRRADTATVIAEYRAAPGGAVADPQERILLEIHEPLPNVTAGTLAFGPDGYLYIGVGNAGIADDPTNTAQDLGKLLGKILRIDVDLPSPIGLQYVSPPTNPFAGPTPGRDEIFAYGLRNPYRFSFDRLTGDLYAGDVGNAAREEINLVRAGGNYGWRIREGAICSGYVPERCDDSGFVEPLVDYAHTGGRCAVVGGHVYRGTQGTLPAGTYVFGDFCSGEIFVLEAGGMRRLLDTPLVISSFGEDAAGELYVADWLGTVYRIIAAGDPGQAPVAAAVLPGSRSVRAGTVATAFATMIWSGAGGATGCRIAPLAPAPAGEFVYQTTDPATNEVTGPPNVPVDIGAGGSQTFLIAFRPDSTFGPRELRLAYHCDNAPAAPVIAGVNTLLLSSASAPVADVVAVSATASRDGVVTLPAGGGLAAFAVSTTNIGAGASITVSADAGTSGLAVDSFVCATHAVTGACTAPPAASLTLAMDGGATSTFSVFVSARDRVEFDPAHHRIHVRFKDGAGVTRGLTSVAVRSR